MVAAQLVNAVPHTDAKFYAATQTMDEARHVEVFAKYIQKLDMVRPIAAPVKRILDATLQTDDWLKKLVGMQIVVEGLALYSFRQMRTLTEEPLLKDLLTYVARDESRHHAYGVQYVERCVPCLSDAQRTELEDFALEAARTLIDDRNQQTLLSSVMQIWSEVGIDVGRAVRVRRARARRAHPPDGERPPPRSGAGLRHPDAAPLRPAERARRDPLPRLPARQPRRQAGRRRRRGVPGAPSRAAARHRGVGAGRELSSRTRGAEARARYMREPVDGTCAVVRHHPE